MSDTVISVEKISKLYRLGEVSTGTLSHDFNRWWHRIRGKENPYLTVGETNDRTVKGESDYVWALRDINFDVKRGEILGIIGRNGAGKSTLLKILSRVTTPTSGQVKVKGRIASLLEVGTGFNPELTGRDNIYLNGSILGMRKREIDQKFDEIVDFAEVDRYIDTPVKRYSSGMYVRLAFAVAAHLEPEILIIDEVLAVGDAQFQNKCLGKIGDVSREGRTVLFVSHNMTAVKSLCYSAVYLLNGEAIDFGEVSTVVDQYISGQPLSSVVHINKENGGFTLDSIEFLDNGLPGNFDLDKDLVFSIIAVSHKSFELININLFFNSVEGEVIFATCSSGKKTLKGEYSYECRIPANTLNDIPYAIDLMVVSNGSTHLHHLTSILRIQGNEPRRDAAWMGKFPGLIRPMFDWKRTKLDL